MNTSELLAKGAAGSTKAMGAGGGGLVLWIALGLAAVFVGYLVLDGYLVWRREQRLKALTERSRRQTAEQEDEARLAAPED